MSEPKVGQILEGTVIRVYPKYAILLFEGGYTGLLHISEISKSFVRNFTSYVHTGNIYKVKVLENDADKRGMKVSVKALTSEERHSPLARKPIPQEEISFTALAEHLPQWIKKENEA